MTFKIRPAHISDIPKVAKIYLSYFSHRLNNIIEARYKFYFLQDYLILHLILNKESFWVVEINKQIIGYIIAPLSNRQVHLLSLLKWLLTVFKHILQGKYGIPFNLICIFIKNRGSFYRNPLAKSLRKFPHIYSIALKKEFQQKGLGTQLVTMALHKHAKNGYLRSWLSVESRNQKAINFYKKLGYKEIGRRDEFLFMMKDLSKNIIG